MPTRNTQLAEVEQETITSHDGLLHLGRNLNIHPDTLIGKGIGIFGAGMIGAGKTTVMARLFEQFGACSLPFALFDLEGDLASLVDLLPRGVLATASNCPTVKEMYQEGLQVVFALESWEGHAAPMMTTLVDGLMNHTSDLPTHLRVPFLIGVDEIAHWVPQHRSGREHMSAADFKAMHASLSALVSRGRKRGLVPCFFTQRFAHAHKDVLAPGTFILMRNTLDTDLARYMEYVDASAFSDGDDLTMRQVKARIARFKEGQAIVKLPSGKQGVVQFHNRESEHTSHAPLTQAALNAYRSVTFTPNKRYGAFLPEGEQKAEPVVPSHAQKSEQEGTIGEQVREMLQAEPGLSGRALAIRLGCSPTTTIKWKKVIEQEAHQEDVNAEQSEDTVQSTPLPLPIIPDKGPRAEEIDLVAAITLWNNGYNSDRKLMKAFSMTQYQANRLSQMIKAQARTASR